MASVEDTETVDTPTEVEAILEEDEEEEREYASDAKAYNKAKELLGDLSLPMLRDSDFEFIV